MHVPINHSDNCTRFAETYVLVLFSPPCCWACWKRVISDHSASCAAWTNPHCCQSVPRHCDVSVNAVVRMYLKGRSSVQLKWEVVYEWSLVSLRRSAVEWLVGTATYECRRCLRSKCEQYNSNVCITLVVFCTQTSTCLVLSASARLARSIAKFTLNVLKISSIKKEI
jgi:hypothetical protein